MEYHGRVPAPPLDRFVDDIYCLAGAPQHRRVLVPPMPSAHLFVNLGEPVRLCDPESSASPAQFADGWFMGMWTRRYVIEYPPTARVLGVHFKPWGLSPFVRFPADEFRDRWVGADAVWDGFSRLRERMADVGSAGEALGLLEGELRVRLTGAPQRGFDLVARTARRLEASWGVVPIGALTAGAGVSSTHLTTRFAAHLGVTPKRLARIYRFARSILSVDAERPVDWAGLAHAAGYFDQAHFSKEFKDFTGHTPTSYLELRRRFPAQPEFPPDDGPMPAD